MEVVRRLKVKRRLKDLSLKGILLKERASELMNTGWCKITDNDKIWVAKYIKVTKGMIVF